MPIPLLILQVVILIVVVILLLRKQPAPDQDPRLAQLAESHQRSSLAWTPTSSPSIAISAAR